jgi:hypothetical protein
MGEVGEVLGEVLRDAKLVARENIVDAEVVELVELVLGVVE